MGVMEVAEEIVQALVSTHVSQVVKNHVVVAVKTPVVVVALILVQEVQEYEDKIKK